MEGLQVAGGQDARSDTAASASQRSQAEVEGEAGARAAVAFMLILFPALINQLTVVVLLQAYPGNS